MTQDIFKIHHIGIVVQNLEASAAWYERHLGFTRSYGFRFPGVEVVFLQRGAARLELFCNEKASAMDPMRSTSDTNLRIGGVNHFALQVADLDATLDRLSADGVAVVSPAREVPNGGGERFAFVHDNENMLVELFQTAAT